MPKVFPKNTHLITNSMEWWDDFLSLFKFDEVSVPVKYRDQVLAVKEALKNDTSGLVNSMIDFAIDAALVDYKIESNNENLEDILDEWLKNVNSSLRGQIPVGIKALAKEYFRERWKGSSVLLLRTFWEKVDVGGTKMNLPTRMVFVDGEDIVVTTPDKDIVTIGEMGYGLYQGKKQDPLMLPTSKSERIYIQKPYASWSDEYGTPYLINRGIYRNMKFLELLSKKGEQVTSKALEYLLVMKKGSEQLAKLSNPDFIYNEEDLKKVKKDFQEITAPGAEKGTPIYVSNFDTQLEHIIPDYSKILSEGLYAPVERRILGGLGLVEVIRGVASDRREAMMNPKPFAEEVKKGIDDFKTLLADIIENIKEANNNGHRKYVNATIQVHNTPIKAFVTDDVKVQLRSAYDRGQLSHETYISVVCDMEYDIEVERRKREYKNGIDIIMYPHIIQNNEQNISQEEQVHLEQMPEYEDLYADEEFNNEDENKSGPEAENYNQSAVVETEKYYRYRQVEPSKFDKETFRIIAISKSKGIRAIVGRLKGKSTTTIQSFLFDKSQWKETECEEWLTKHKETASEYVDASYEEAPYKTTNDLPPNVKNSLPKEAQKIYVRVFNQAYPKGEDYARKVAWSVVKKFFRKEGDKWVKISKGELEKASLDSGIDIKELIEIKKLEVLGKQQALLDKIEEDNDETPQ